MARFTVVQEVDAPAEAVWGALVDWPRHGDWAPLTVVRTVPGPAEGVGAGFVARTGVGPLAFDDPMTVVAWQAPAGDRPGRCEVVKSGRVVHGRAWFSVTPLADRRCRVVWFEEVTVSPRSLTRLAGPVLSLAGRLGFAATLRAVARDVERDLAARSGPR
ncbi:SRPBCC family protein [Paractinoplanes lichenicola]|uniref:SRPBCC family protein n=1 Tax=Paractinoplanes lichenicola TaxID=2802976 RepID=A0ABS1W0K8_9ACTN|nr:SRPBCC family protein [Actinoplanes lichenicola]MBL7260244.1 SRPBCC family protein [Actinoplanes lichenicola]